VRLTKPCCIVLAERPCTAARLARSCRPDTLYDPRLSRSVNFPHSCVPTVFVADTDIIIMLCKKQLLNYNSVIISSRGLRACGYTYLGAYSIRRCINVTMNRIWRERRRVVLQHSDYYTFQFSSVAYLRERDWPINIYLNIQTYINLFCMESPPPTSMCLEN